LFFFQSLFFFCAEQRVVRRRRHREYRATTTTTTGKFSFFVTTFSLFKRGENTSEMREYTTQRERREREKRTCRPPLPCVGIKPSSLVAFFAARVEDEK
jgi:hypothetical protein